MTVRTPMTDLEVLAGIQDVAREHLDLAQDVQLDPAHPLVETLQLDSVRMLTLVAELENRFRVVLEEGDEADLVTVADLIALLQRRLQADATPESA